MTVSAILKNARISPRKMEPVINKIRGLFVDKAINILTFSNKKSAFLLKKVLKSVISNAENNNKLNSEKLYVKKLYVLQGQKLKRFRMRAKGRLVKIIKRNSHIFIELGEID